jgi:hypothetical protein
MPFNRTATFASVLKRHGLTTPRRRGRRRVPGVIEPFAPATSANAVWCIEQAQWVLDSAFRVRAPRGHPLRQRIQPGKPQQSGRLERFHRTLKAETASPPERNLRAQQRAFDLFRAEYNHQRPHEALGNKVPASKYVPSTRQYPCSLIQPATGSFAQVLTIDKHGFIRWARHRVFVSTALACERVEVLPDGDTGWLVHFGSVELGRFDDQHPHHGLKPRPRPRRDNYLQL